MSMPDSWRAALAEAPHPLGGDGATRLAQYAEQLAQAVRPPNLTGLRDLRRIDEVLVRPSLVLAFAVNDAPARVADIGSGNGFPGVVAAALWPNAQVCLVERRTHKASAVQDLVRAARLSCTVASCDARDLPREYPAWVATCDVVTVRAVAALGPTTRLAAPLLAPGGVVVHWKSNDLAAAEREEGARVARALGLVPRDDVVAPSLASARLVIYERSAS